MMKVGASHQDIVSLSEVWQLASGLCLVRLLAMSDEASLRPQMELIVQLEYFFLH